MGRDQVDPDTLRAFEVVNGSMIHDIGNLHGMFGSPRRVVSANVWAGGVALTTVLEYAGDARAVCTWVDLPELFSFEETLEVYGSRDRVFASFPTGWSRGLPTDVTVQQIDAEGHAASTTRSWQANPFKLELEHFAACIARGEQPLTPGREAIEHVALVRDIVLACTWKEPLSHAACRSSTIAAISRTSLSRPKSGRASCGSRSAPWPRAIATTLAGKSS